MRRLKDFAPITKFALLLAVIACAYLSKGPWPVAALIGAQAFTAVLGGAGRVYRTTLLALLVGALTLTLFQIFFIPDGQTVFFLVPPLRWGRVTDVGLSVSLLMSLRMIASVGAIPLLVAFTPSTQLVSLISGTFRLPPSYTCMLVTALRFIPTFGERMGQVLQAEACRGYRADTANVFRKIGMVLKLSLPLLVTCVRDVDNLSLSLEARGFDPESRTRVEPILPSSGEWAVLAAAFGVVTLFTAARLLG